MYPTVFYDGSEVARQSANLLSAGNKAVQFESRTELGINRITGDSRLTIPEFATAQAALESWHLCQLLRKELMFAVQWWMFETIGLPDPDSFLVIGVGHPLVIGLISPTPSKTCIPRSAEGFRYRVVPDRGIPRITECTYLEDPTKGILP